MLDSIVTEPKKTIRHQQIQENISTKKTIRTPPKQKDQVYITYQIEAFLGAETSIDQRETFLTNTRVINEDMHFFITGNSLNTQLFISIPIQHKSYVETVFYGLYEHSILTGVQEIPALYTNYIHFEKPENIQSSNDFTKKEKYTDPFKDIIGVFQQVPEDTTLLIGYSVSRHKNVSFWEKITHARKYFFSKKNQKVSETGESHAERVLNIGFHIETRNKKIKHTLRTTLQSLFHMYCKSGNVSIHSSAQDIPVDLHELSNFFHVPLTQTPIKGFQYNPYKQLAYPNNLPKVSDKKSILLGNTIYRNENKPVSINYQDIQKHVYLLGKTGTGKSTCMAQMVMQAMQHNKGLCLIDPHGDLVDTCMAHIPSHRTNDIILFDISDIMHPLGFNLLHYSDEEEKNLIVSGVISVFHKLFSMSRGPRLEYILRNTLLSVIEYPNATLIHVLKMLTNETFRKKVLQYVKDDIVKKFRDEEFNKRAPKQRQEAIGPITNKIGQFLSSSTIRNIFGQPQGKVQFRKAMDEGKIVLINLSKGKIGEDTTKMLGSLLVTKLQIDAMKRADVNYEERKPFYLFIDEFQNFATDSFATILSEARKYQLGLVIANQYTSQLSEDTKKAVFGNIGTLVTFGLGYEDAAEIASQYKNLVSANDFLSLPKYTAYVRLMINGSTSEPFSMQTLPLSGDVNTIEEREKVRQQSRQRYTLTKEEVEQLIQARDKKDEEKITIKKPEKKESTESNVKTDISESETGQPEGIASTEKLELWQTYTGKVKFKYNYGIFVTYGPHEGLLHKNDIKVPAEGVSRKKFYHEGDNIQVIAKEYKTIKGEEKVVWIQ